MAFTTVQLGKEPNLWGDKNQGTQGLELLAASHRN